MKLLLAYTPSHAGLKDSHCLPTLKDEFELIIRESDIQGEGRYMEPDWSGGVTFKNRMILRTIRENPGEIFLYSDVDVRFYAPVRDIVLDCMQDRDIVGHVDDCMGTLCTGFLAIRANPETRRLWEAVLASLPASGRDQLSFNRLLWSLGDIRWGFLPASFFGAGTFDARRWTPGKAFYIPQNPRLFHANWTVGIENKIKLLEHADRIIGAGSRAVDRNNREVLRDRSLARQVGKVRALIGDAPRRQPLPHRSLAEPRRLRIEASSVCQLKCPACPTADGTIARAFGAGFLKAASLQSFLDRHPHVTDIELSNWGEAFLNPEFLKILELAHARNIALTLGNGVNLNRAPAAVLEGLVKYRLRFMTCSIDGASQATYSTYRIHGDFERVIGHIGTINAYKALYRSDLPVLRWQFVAFGHNEHEIGKARAMAAALGMEFYLKLSWDDLYGRSFCPVEDKEAIRRESGLDVADRREYEEKYRRSFIRDTCHQMWESPQIHHDGTLLGCCVNHFGDYGNVFSEGLGHCLTQDRMKVARAMLLGLAGPQEDIPCSQCGVYAMRKQYGDWVDPRHFTRVGDAPHP